MSEIDLNSPEVKEAIKLAVQEATSGLIAKRDELLGEVKKLRKGQEISPDDYQKLKEQNEELEDQLKEANKLVKASTSEIEKERKARESETNYVQRLLIENGLNDALLKANVKPELAKAAKALFAGQAQIKVDGENRKALIGDKDIGDFVAEWSKTDEGKHFIAAPVNGGGNGQGSGTGTGTGNDLSKLSPVERITAAREAAKH